MAHQHKEHPTLKMDTLLADDQSSFRKLVKKAQTIQKLGQQLKSNIDPAIKDHVTLANINNGVATLLTPSSAWATRLRYNIPAILDVLHNKLGQTNIKTIRIKISPVKTDISVAPTKARKLSGNTANIIKQTAYGFSDTELRDALLKIAKHHVASED